MLNYLNQKRIGKKTSGRRKLPSRNLGRCSPWNKAIGSQRKLLQPSTLPNFDACDGLATAATVLASWMNERNMMGVSDVEPSMRILKKTRKEKSCFQIGSCPKHCNSEKKKVNRGRLLIVRKACFPGVQCLGSRQLKKSYQTLQSQPENFLRSCFMITFSPVSKKFVEHSSTPIIHQTCWQ